MNYFSADTIIGHITICANKKAITRLCFSEYQKNDDDINIETVIIQDAFNQLQEYLRGSRKSFDLKLEYSGSNFQMLVLDQLRKIQYGKTKTYKEIAYNINNPKSSVAVGAACGKNPIPIFVPCHRVIGSNGNLTGYNGGLNLKNRLLQIEASQQD